MKALNIAIAVLFALPLFAGDCLKDATFHGDTVEASVAATSQPSAVCTAALNAINVSDPVTLTIGSKSFSGLSVKKKEQTGQINKVVFDFTAMAPDGRVTLLQRLRNVETAKVSVGTLAEDVGVHVIGLSSYSVQSLIIGPATKRNEANNEPAAATADAPADESASNALRLKYDYLYEYRPAEERGLIGRIDLNVDTTDEGEGFIDDNRFAITGGYGDFEFGDLIVEGLIGGRARYTHAIHTGDYDQDAMVTFSAGIPLIQAFAFGGGDFAAPPLHVDLNYGYRHKHVGDKTSNGPFFEGTVQHNIFLMRDYWLAVSATFTVDDADDRPATTRRTRRLYRVAISQFDDKDKVVSLLTSFEDGSARVIADKVRQYFIGIGINWKR